MLDSPLKIIREWFASLDDFTRDCIAYSCIYYLKNADQTPNTRALFFEVLNAEWEYNQELGKALTFIALIDYILDKLADPTYWDNILEMHLDLVDSDSDSDLKAKINAGLPKVPKNKEAFVKAGTAWKELRDTSLDLGVIQIWESQMEQEFIKNELEGE